MVRRACPIPLSFLVLLETIPVKNFCGLLLPVDYFHKEQIFALSRRRLQLPGVNYYPMHPFLENYIRHIINLLFVSGWKKERICQRRSLSLRNHERGRKLQVDSHDNAIGTLKKGHVCLSLCRNIKFLFWITDRWFSQNILSHRCPLIALENYLYSYRRSFQWIA